MPLWSWIALGVFVVALVVTTATLLVLALRTLRRFRAFRRTTGAALEELLRAAEELERRVSALTERSEEVERRIGSLSRSVERVRVLAWALGDAKDVIARLREAVPRK